LRLSILIPAYYEQSTIADVVRLVRAVELESMGIQKEIIVCDDGSADQTGAEVTRAAEGDPRVQLVRHTENRGKGAAIRTALAHATGDVCLIQDADLEYSVDDYRALMQPMLDGADVVYGSRFRHRSWPEGMHTANYVANRILTTTANVLYGHHITDEATAFKVFRTDILKSLALECDGFEFCPEVTAKLGRRKIKIVEVPIRYTGHNLEQGKKIRWTDGVKAFATLVKYRFSAGKPR
jgi:glycosyltransferase involved in cell wall biosynthesis